MAKSKSRNKQAKTMQHLKILTNLDRAFPLSDTVADRFAGELTPDPAERALTTLQWRYLQVARHLERALDLPETQIEDFDNLHMSSLVMQLIEERNEYRNAAPYSLVQEVQGNRRLGPVDRTSYLNKLGIDIR